jgi:hypothetical protein
MIGILSSSRSTSARRLRALICSLTQPLARAEFEHAINFSSAAAAAGAEAETEADAETAACDIFSLLLTPHPTTANCSLARLQPSFRFPTSRNRSAPLSPPLYPHPSFLRPSQVDGPSHFVNLAGGGRRHNGATRLKRRLLERAGYRVVSVLYWEWDACAGPAEQTACMRRLLQGLVELR